MLIISYYKYYRLMKQAATRQLAQELHQYCLLLLRGLRVADLESQLPTAQLSALSVLVFAGPKTLSELARMEQVSTPTMSRTVDYLEKAGMVRRARDKRDRRVVYALATREGRQTMEEARSRRLAHLVSMLETLKQEDLAQLQEIVPKLQQSLAQTSLIDSSN